MDEFSVFIEVDERRRWDRKEKKMHKMIRSKWLDDWKAGEGSFIRSRLVGQEIAWDVRNDTFAGTPPTKAIRLVVSLQSSRPPPEGRTERSRQVAVYDVSVAFFHAKITDILFVLPPSEMRKAGRLWLLLAALYGTRKASQLWAEYIEQKLLAAGFTKITVIPCCYFHEEKVLDVVVHGDDFIAGGEPSSLDWFDGVMLESFKTKRVGRVGPGGDESVKFLNRALRWSPKGFELEPDVRHADRMIKDLGLENSKGTDSPGTKTVEKNILEACDLLDATEKKLFMSIAGTGLYLAIDRPDIQFAMGQIMMDMKSPMVSSMLKLRRLVKYLINHRRISWYFPYQTLPKVWLIYTDSDWAGCQVPRKSVSGAAEVFGSHLINTWSARQSTIALSSGEAEFYSLGSGASHGLLSKNLLSELKVETELRLRSDSSAGLGMAQRQGVGRVRHLDTRLLWLQDAVRSKRLAVEKWPGDTNISDIGTKYLDGARLRRLMDLTSLRASTGWLLRDAVTKGVVAILLMSEECNAKKEKSRAEGNSAGAISELGWWFDAVILLVLSVGVLQIVWWAVHAYRFYMKVTQKGTLEYADKDVQTLLSGDVQAVMSDSEVQQQGSSSSGSSDPIMLNVVQLQSPVTIPQDNVVQESVMPTIIPDTRCPRGAEGEYGLWTVASIDAEIRRRGYIPSKDRKQEKVALLRRLDAVGTANAPSKAQLDFARILAGKAKVGLTTEVLTDKVRCSEFIDQYRHLMPARRR